MDHTITLTLTEEQENKLSELTDLWNAKTVCPISKTDFLGLMLKVGFSYTFEDKISFWEVNLKNYCKN